MYPALIFANYESLKCSVTPNFFTCYCANPRHPCTQTCVDIDEILSKYYKGVLQKAFSNSISLKFSTDNDIICNQNGT